jgi:hypothetical protein
MGIWQQLEDRAAAGDAARVANVGAGYVGGWEPPVHVLAAQLADSLERAHAARVEAA